VSTFVNGEHRALVLPIIAAAMIVYAVIAILLGLADTVKKRREKKRQDRIASVVNVEE
jgi:hypothetical protein